MIINSYNLLNSLSHSVLAFLVLSPRQTFYELSQGSGIYLFFTGDALEKCHSESCICVWRSLSRQLKERKNLKVSLVVFQVRRKLFGKLNSFWRHTEDQYLQVINFIWKERREQWGVFGIITRYYYMRECWGTEEAKQWPV